MKNHHHVQYSKKTHATKNNKTPTTPQPSFPPYAYPYPMYPPPYGAPVPYQNYPFGSPTRASISTVKSTPDLKCFLQELDEEYGKDGEYTQFLDSLEDEAVHVAHIKHLTAEQFERLGITGIGWQIALKKASEKYK